MRRRRCRTSISPMMTEAGTCRGSLTSGRFFPARESRKQDEAIIYGADTDGMLPVLLHPNEWLDGALCRRIIHLSAARKRIFIKTIR